MPKPCECEPDENEHQQNAVINEFILKNGGKIQKSIRGGGRTYASHTSKKKNIEGRTPADERGCRITGLPAVDECCKDCACWSDVK